MGFHIPFKDFVVHLAVSELSKLPRQEQGTDCRTCCGTLSKAEGGERERRERRGGEEEERVRGGERESERERENQLWPSLLYLAIVTVHSP